MSRGEVALQIDEGIKEGLSLQEISWCETFLRTASFRQACKEALIDAYTAKDLLKRPVVQAYIMSKSLAYKNLDSDKLNREDLKRILNTIAQDPTTKPELRLNAVSKLNDMLEFDTEHKNDVIDEDEPEEIKLTAEEAEEMLKKIRSK